MGDVVGKELGSIRLGTRMLDSSEIADIIASTSSDIVETVRALVAGRAPANHASFGTTYGVATGELYGHVKLSDSTSSQSGVSDGSAATPKAVKDALIEAKNYTDQKTGAVDIASRMKKSTVLGNLNLPPVDPVLPAGYGDLTVNQVLYAVHAGASENE